MTSTSIFGFCNLDRRGGSCSRCGFSVVSSTWSRELVIIGWSRIRRSSVRLGDASEEVGRFHVISDGGLVIDLGFCMVAGRKIRVLVQTSWIHEVGFWFRFWIRASWFGKIALLWRWMVDFWFQSGVRLARCSLVLECDLFAAVWSQESNSDVVCLQWYVKAYRSFFWMVIVWIDMAEAVEPVRERDVRGSEMDLYNSYLQLVIIEVWWLLAASWCFVKVV